MAAAALARAQEIHAPAALAAGSSTAISTAGSGDATYYLVGPSTVLKKQVRLGDQIEVQSEDLQATGHYIAIVCSQSCQHAEFDVVPGETAQLSLLVHPSRVAVGQQKALSGVALPFDRFQNLVVQPIRIDFQLKGNASNPTSLSVTTNGGVAWFRVNSGTHAEAIQLVASANGISSRRVIQQVASDPCNLRVSAHQAGTQLEVQTNPVRDCSGNPVPDGTIVTFRETGGGETSTVDAPVKQGIARARMMISGEGTLSVASGVVMGNEVHVGAGEQ
jgi:hypothetical protein